MDSSYESDHDPISMEMLEEICDRIQSHPNINRKEARYRIRDCIKKIQSELKGSLQDTQNMVKVLHKVFDTVVKEVQQDLPPLGESGSEVPHFIPEHRNFAEVTKFSDDIKKSWLKSTIKEIKHLIKNQTFLVEDPKKD